MNRIGERNERQMNERREKRKKDVTRKEVGNEEGGRKQERRQNNLMMKKTSRGKEKWRGKIKEGKKSKFCENRNGTGK